MLALLHLSTIFWFSIFLLPNWKVSDFWDCTSIAGLYFFANFYSCYGNLIGLNAFSGGDLAGWGSIIAAAAVTPLPTLILFLPLQRAWPQDWQPVWVRSKDGYAKSIKVPSPTRVTSKYTGYCCNKSKYQNNPVEFVRLLGILKK